MNMSWQMSIGPIFFKLPLKNTTRAVIFPQRPKTSTIVAIRQYIKHKAYKLN